MRILRVFNNNVVLARDVDDGEVVLTGRGLGFQRKPGQPVDETLIVQRFYPSGERTPSDLGLLLAEIQPEHLALAAEALDLARASLGRDLRGGVVVPLADHLGFAIERAAAGQRIEYPLRGEVSHLYPREFEVARRIVKLVNVRLDVELPPEEAVAVALHLVNAAFGTEDLAKTFQMTEVFDQILQVVASMFGPVDTEGVAAARFVTHLRYFFIRMNDDTQHAGAPLPYSDAVVSSYPEQYRCAINVQHLLELRLGKPITAEELVYLTMHIARLTTSER